MQFNEFCARICDDIKVSFENQGIPVTRVDIHKVVKNNGHNLTALMIQQENINVTPTIYLEPYYDRYTHGVLYEDVIAEVERFYMKAVPSQDFDISNVINFDVAKDNIVYTLVNYDKNTEFLKSVPYKQIEDLALIYKILLPENDLYGEMATISINNNLFNLYNVSVEELHEIAEENMKRLLPGKVRHITDLLEGFAVPWIENIEMYAVSNEKNIMGAASILEPEIMDALAKNFGNTYYVIPSSIHEVLVVSENMAKDKNMQKMIAEVNGSQLWPDEILGDKPYIVDAVEHKLILAERKEEYFKEKELQKQKQEKLQEEEKTMNVKGPKL